jgi:hypothetical protein
MRHFLPLFLVALAAPAQVVSVGVTGGVPVTPALSGYSYDNPYLDTGRWTVGPTIEFHLVSGLSAEIGMLLRGYRIVESGLAFPLNAAPQLYSFRRDAHDFDFPLLLKYRFLSGSRRPFVDAGYVFTHESFDDLESASILAGTGISGLSNLPVGGPPNLSQNLHGGAIGIGEEFKYRKIRIAPELRFSYLRAPVGSAPQRVLSVLVGFSF